MNKQVAGNLLLWGILYLFWVLVFQHRSLAFSKTLTVEFCYLVFIAANYYLAIFFTVPTFLYRKKYLHFAVALLAGIVTAALLRAPLAQYMNRNYFGEVAAQAGFAELFINSFLNIFIWVICLVAGKLIIDRIRLQQYVDNIEKQRTVAELDFLKAQFNPHFLFNSINSIYGHIDKNNASARNMLLTFSDMLRYQLYECNTEVIGIDKELHYVRNYIALQRVRKEANLVVNIDIGENVRGFNIVPLIFIVFIENAFKYVSNCENMENKVDIAFHREGDHLLFRVFNTKEGRGPSATAHKGIGLLNVKRRLELLYPGRHELDIDDRTDAYCVSLKLELV